MRVVGVVTTSRADYGILLPLLRAIHADSELQLKLFVSGVHLAESGGDLEAIERDGFEIAERVDMLLASDSPEGISKSMGVGTLGFAQAFARNKPDILLVIGDRYEMHAAVVAAVPFKIPVAHLHGGEVTEGAFDECFRHAITKMSHLHFVATEEYGQRVRQLGEESWRVVVCGAPSLDNLDHVRRLSSEEIFALHGVQLPAEFLLVTFHPVTLEYEQTEQHVANLLAALEAGGMPVLFTAANADTHGRTVNRLIGEYVATHSSAQRVDNLGTESYFSVMALATAMVGNSSSGILEAASYRLPVVNIGNRQRGRAHGPNVIDANYGTDDILAAVREAVHPRFRRSLDGLRNPYDMGGATAIILRSLRQIALDQRLILKRFVDIDANIRPVSHGVHAQLN